MHKEWSLLQLVTYFIHFIIFIPCIGVSVTASKVDSALTYAHKNV